MKTNTLNQVKYDQHGGVDIEYYTRKARQLRSDMVAEQVDKLVNATKHLFSNSTDIRQVPKAA